MRAFLGRLQGDRVRREKTYVLDMGDDVPPHVPREQEDPRRIRRELVDAVLAPRFTLVPLPGVVAHLTELLARDRLDAEDLCWIVERDVALSGQVMRRVMARMSRLPVQPVVDLNRALIHLGRRHLQSVVLSTVQGEVFRSAALDHLMREQVLHNHTVARGCAAVFKALGLHPSRGYLCGLMHDVGRHAVLVALERYARRDPGWLEPDLVRRVLDAHHGEVGARVLARWGFPPVFGEVARFHDAPHRATRFRRAVYAVALANTGDRAEVAGTAARAAHLSRRARAWNIELSDGQLRSLAYMLEKARRDPHLSLLLQ